MTEFKQIVGRGTRVHEDTHKYYFTLMDFRGATSHFADPDFDGEPVQIYEPGEDDPIAPPDDVPPTDEDGETLPPSPARTKSSSIGRPTSRCRAGGKTPQDLRQWRRRHHHRRARRVSRRGRQAGHREPARLHQEGAQEALRQPRRLPQALEGRRAQAGDHRGAGGRGAAARSARRGGRQGPRPLRPDLPRRLRPTAADPPRARRQRPQARRLHQVRPAGPRRARALLQKYQDEGVLNLDDPNSSRSRPSTRWARRCSSSGSSARGRFRARRARTARRSLSRKPPRSCPSAPPSNPSRTSCARTSASMATRSASSQLCWMFFLKIIDDQDQELELMEPATARRSPKSCSGAPGRPTPRASPATSCSASSTTSCSRR